VSGIAVAICTHDRPEDLARLLDALKPQLAQCGATLVVVDNGSSSSETIVMQRGSVNLAYVRLGEPGLVAARNAALRASLAGAPRFIAFIDDDEVPDPNWLAALRDCLEATGADICCGPLRPKFDIDPPAWAIRGGFFAKSGVHIGTGNIMFRSAILPAGQAGWFQPAFGHTGGEDEELFSRLIAAGARYATAQDAWVTERVPAHRLSLQYIVRTGLRDGAIAVALSEVRRQSRITAALRHAAAKTGYALAHVVQSPAGPWHLVAALRDISEVAGTLAALGGSRIRHYG
jgi:glycosyltransferase involved in cell wall biosynthesis